MSRRFFLITAQTPIVGGTVMTTMVFESDGFFRRSEFFKQTKESIKKQGREATGDPNILLIYEMTAEEYEEFTS